jgi:hypothetical protein
MTRWLSWLGAPMRVTTSALMALRRRLIARARKWHAGAVPNDLVLPSHQLDQCRSLYEQGAISQEEFDRLRSLVGGQVRQALDLPAKPATRALDSATDGPGDDYLGIWKHCIQNSTPVHPVRLVGLISYVSNRHAGHLIFRKALAGLLQDWIEAGYVAEIRPHTYYDATGQSVPKTFSGISDEAYSEAVDLLRKMGHWPDPYS